MSGAFNSQLPPLHWLTHALLHANSPRLYSNAVDDEVPLVLEAKALLVARAKASAVSRSISSHRRSSPPMIRSSENSVLEGAAGC